jgi:hypothetical protein
MSNALKCFLNDNCRGFLLPEDPVNLKSRWRCNICSKVGDNLSENFASFEVVKNIYENVDKEIKTIENGQEEDQVSSYSCFYCLNQ